MEKHIIGIAGADGTGKTTLARQLDRKRESLANPIYLEIIKEQRLKTNLEEFKCNLDKNKYREMLRAIGKAKREVREDYWVEKLFQKINKSLCNLFVIDDIRYRNEAQAIKDRRGYLVFLDRPITARESEYDSFKELDEVKEMSNLVLESRFSSPEEMAKILNKKLASYYLDKTLSFMSSHSLSELIEIGNRKK